MAVVDGIGNVVDRYMTETLVYSNMYIVRILLICDVIEAKYATYFKRP